MRTLEAEFWQKDHKESGYEGLCGEIKGGERQNHGQWWYKQPLLYIKHPLPRLWSERDRVKERDGKIWGRTMKERMMDYDQRWDERKGRVMASDYINKLYSTSDNCSPHASAWQMLCHYWSAFNQSAGFCNLKTPQTLYTYREVSFL